MDSTKYGGLEHYLVELTSYLRQRQVNTVLQYEILPQSSAYLQDLESQAAIVSVLPVRGNVLRSALNIAGLVRTHQPSVVHTHFCKGSVRLVAPIIARGIGVSQSVTSVHNFHNLERKSLNRFAYNFYDHVLAVSDAVRRDLLSGGVNTAITKTHYLGLFGDRQRSRDLGLQVRRELGIDESAVVFGCLAFDTPFKGLDIL